VGGYQITGEIRFNWIAHLDAIVVFQRQRQRQRKINKVRQAVGVGHLAGVL